MSRQLIPCIMNAEELGKILTEIVEGFKSGDTLEGSIEFTVNSEDTWFVQASYRIGNLEGQGGTRLVGLWYDDSEEDNTQVWNASEDK